MRGRRERSPLERKIQADIEAAIGAEPDLLLLRNSVGEAQYVKDDGKVWYVPYGLGIGSPDLVGILGGRWFCLEVKVPGDEPDDHQLRCHAVWRRFGAFVEVVTSVDEAKAALARARKAAA